MASGFSRRGLFSFLARPLKATGDAAKDMASTLAGSGNSNPEAAPQRFVAIIQGRHCTAPDNYCSLCVERCPEPGAMTAHDIIPMVVAEVCTGCGICHQVCPAPDNAVLMLPRPEPPPDEASGAPPTEIPN
jgi:Pyruvate/2-oxoacid:ferredoxin oxidoreductase delta subunit